jgi:hypothetical protein
LRGQWRGPCEDDCAEGEAEVANPSGHGLSWGLYRAFGGFAWGSEGAEDDGGLGDCASE